MKQLADMEAGFQDHVLNGDPAIEGEIAGASEEFRRVRLGIYRDAYRLRLVEVLYTDYEVLRKYLGDDLFEAAARDYLAAHPSTFRNVRWFGGEFSRFLESTPRYAQYPVLAELARFEWTLGLAFDSRDAEPVHFEEIAAVPAREWAEMRFLPHASLHVIELSTNAVSIWQEIDAQDSFEVMVSAQPVTWGIWRKKHSPYFRSMDNEEAWALKAMLAGETFGTICQGLCQWIAEEEAPARAAGMLRGWVDEGWIGQVLVTSQPSLPQNQRKSRRSQ